MDDRVILIIEVNKEDWNKLKYNIKKTKTWKEDGVKYGKGMQLCTDPEYMEDAYGIDAKLIEVLGETT